MKNKDKSALVYKLLIILAILVPIILGISYAYFLAVIKGNQTNISGAVVNEFIFDIETENDGYISATNIIPLTEDQIEEYASSGTFKVTAGANKYNIKYEISLTEIAITSGLKNADFKWALIHSSDSNKNFNGTFETINGTDKVLAQNIIITPSSEDNYTLRVWVANTDQDQSGIMNQTFSAKVKVSGEFVAN